MLTQIYEVATPAEAEAISAIGVDHIGVLVGDGAFRRELPVHNACATLDRRLAALEREGYIVPSGGAVEDE